MAKKTKKKRVMNPYGIPGMTTLEFKDAAKAAGYNPLIASHLRRYAEEFKSDAPMDPTGTQKFLDTYAAGRETTDPKEPTEEKPTDEGDPFNPDKPDVKHEPYVPTPKTSSASEGSGLDYLRDAKGMRARELDARLSGHTQRLLRERRFKSNLDEMMGKKEGKPMKDSEGNPMKDSEGNPMFERTGGLTRFRREEAERIGDEKKKWNDARGPGGELLGRLIRDKAGRTVGHSTTSAGRAALGESYTKGSSGVLGQGTGVSKMDQGSFAEKYGEDYKGPVTPEDEGAVQDWEEKRRNKQRMASRSNKFRDLWRRTQEGRLTD